MWAEGLLAGAELLRVQRIGLKQMFKGTPRRVDAVFSCQNDEQPD